MNARKTVAPGAKTVLVVDDEQGIRDIVTEMIAEMGYAVHGAESGEKALDMMAHMPFDLVISDLKMDGMNGLDLARRLRDLFPSLPLALMTAFPNEDVHLAVKNKSVDFLLEKPFQMEDLQGMVLSLAG